MQWINNNSWVMIPAVSIAILLINILIWHFIRNATLDDSECKQKAPQRVNAFSSSGGYQPRDSYKEPHPPGAE